MTQKGHGGLLITALLPFLAVGNVELAKGGTFDNKEQEEVLPGPGKEGMVPRHQACAGVPAEQCASTEGLRPSQP